MIARTLRRWFLMIQEPRHIRIAMFVFYALVLATGVEGFYDSPGRFFNATGPFIIYSIATFFVLGGIAGAIAILPGYWWLEKVGLVAIAFGIAMRGVLVGALGVSIQGAFLLLALVVLLVVRFLSIRRADLAPIAG